MIINHHDPSKVVCHRVFMKESHIFHFLSSIHMVDAVLIFVIVSVVSVVAVDDDVIVGIVFILIILIVFWSDTKTVNRPIHFTPTKPKSQACIGHDVKSQSLFLFASIYNT